MVVGARQPEVRNLFCGLMRKMTLGHVNTTCSRVTVLHINTRVANFPDNLWCQRDAFNEIYQVWLIGPRQR